MGYRPCRPELFITALDSSRRSGTDTLQGKDAERIREFLLEHRPHVVAVGAAGLEARQLKVRALLASLPCQIRTDPPGISDIQGLLQTSTDPESNTWQWLGRIPRLKCARLETCRQTWTPFGMPSWSTMRES